MKKAHSLLITVLFCAFLGGISLYSILLPDRSFSELENRNLRSVPELTCNRFTSGRYMIEAEQYISDQIAFRDGWVALKALGERLTGKCENNGVYFACDDALISRVEEPDAAVLTENMAYLNTFVENTDVPVYFALIPSAAYVWQDKLPKGAPTADEAFWINEVYSRSQARNIDVASALISRQDTDIYYRTDHHWTSLGAFYGANAILSQMKMEPLILSDYDGAIVSDDFYGTNYSTSCAWWVKPDQMITYVTEEGKEVISNFTGEEESGRLYASEYLEVKNQYAYFLGGNQPLCVIRSQADGPKILILRDSYADCLAPFLSERFSEVHLFDLRYNRLWIQDYIREEEINIVLILYSFANYIEDENQFLLAR